MADEFVDLYEVLELPLDAERATLRKKINEMYIEAQRNLDHRTFATRIKFQELYEITLPQARYILLDEGRRDDYNRMVSSFRAAKNGAASLPDPSTSVAKSGPGETIPSLGPGVAESFRLVEETPQVAGAGTLPSVNGDPEKLAAERDELWKKWKSGLEEALARDESDERASKLKPPPLAIKPAPRPTESLPAPPPRASQTASASPNNRDSAGNPAAPVAKKPSAPIAFDFGADNVGRRGDSAPVPGAEELVAATKLRMTPEEVKKRQDERRREVTKEILETVQVKGSMMGGFGVGIPLFIAVFIGLNQLYPNAGEPLLPIPSWVAWLLGLAIVLAGAFVAGQSIARSMRHKVGDELAVLPIEELVKRTGRNY